MRFGLALFFLLTVRLAAEAHHIGIITSAKPDENIIFEQSLYNSTWANVIAQKPDFTGTDLLVPIPAEFTSIQRTQMETAIRETFTAANVVPLPAIHFIDIDVVQLDMEQSRLATVLRAKGLKLGKEGVRLAEMLIEKNLAIVESLKRWVGEFRTQFAAMVSSFAKHPITVGSFYTSLRADISSVAWFSIMGDTPLAIVQIVATQALFQIHYHASGVIKDFKFNHRIPFVKKGSLVDSLYNEQTLVKYYVTSIAHSFSVAGIYRTIAWLNAPQDFAPPASMEFVQLQAPMALFSVPFSMAANSGTRSLREAELIDAQKERTLDVSMGFIGQLASLATQFNMPEAAYTLMVVKFGGDLAIGGIGRLAKQGKLEVFSASAILGAVTKEAKAAADNTTTSLSRLPYLLRPVFDTIKAKQGETIEKVRLGMERALQSLNSPYLECGASAAQTMMPQWRRPF